MALWVAFLSFKEGVSPLQGLEAFERRKTFEHPPQATVRGEYWVNSQPGQPQAVLIWEADDEGPGDYYEAAWGDLFDIAIAQATPPITEIPDDLPGNLRDFL
ncbi:MAG: hypothetical protein ACE5EF_04730 [Dehalococcoidia bacterium]